MNESKRGIEMTIAQQSEMETWRRIRVSTRRRLIASITLGVIYVMAALAIGAFLNYAVQHVIDGIIVYEGWDAIEVDLDWMTRLIWGYAVLAVIAVIVYPLALLLIAGRLPWWLVSVARTIPGVGSTTRAIALGDVCQSMYQSILCSQTDVAATADAAAKVRDSSMRHWLKRSSRRIESGESFSSLMLSSPIRDPTWSTLRAILKNPLSDNQVVGVWHQSAAECHVLAVSRLNRSVQMIAISGLLISVTLASLALLTTLFFIVSVLRGYYFWDTLLSGLMSL